MQVQLAAMPAKNEAWRRDQERQKVVGVVTAIVGNQIGNEQTRLYLKSEDYRFDNENWDRLHADIATRLRSLTAATLGDYDLRPVDYEAWRAVWKPEVRP